MQHTSHEPFERLEHLEPKKRKWAGGIVIAVFVVFSLLLAWFVGRPMVRFVSEPQQFRAWVDAHGLWGRAAFTGMVLLQVVIAVIPGEPLEIGAGYAFGALEGTLLCLLGTTLGGMLVFGLVRRYGLRLVEVFFSREKIYSLRFMRDEKRLNLLTFLVFFIPGTPKDLLTYFVGLTPIPFGTFCWITAVARIPSIVTSTIGGSALGMKNYVFALIAFGATALLSLGGLLIYRSICRRHERQNSVPENASPRSSSEPGPPGVLPR